MGSNSAIEWTDSTWNPWHGCHKVSAGCKNCYMFRDKKRFGQDPTQVVRASDKTFYAPLKLKEPQRVFTCSWSDFFIEEADAWRDEAFAVMALTPHITYQILTKRPDRMMEYLRDLETRMRIAEEMDLLIFHKSETNKVLAAKRVLGMHDTNVFGFTNEENPYLKLWPLPNVLLGISVEDQKTADERIPILLQTPAAIRFLSVEPLLGAVDLTSIRFKNSLGNMEDWNALDRCVMPNGVDDPTLVGVNDPIVDWVIAGGESGPNARPMHPDWVRSIRDQCVDAGVPFFFKQGSQANWPKFKDFDSFPAEFQIREFPNA